MIEKDIKVILVDDHQLILDGLRSLLDTKNGISIQATFNNGSEVLTWMRHNSTVDLVIVDVNMPGMSGIDLCMAIKKEFADIKVLILSMYQNTGVIKEALMAEADGYIIKNAGEKDFIEAISRVVDGGTYFSEAILPIIYKEHQKEIIKSEAVAKLTDRELEILKLIVSELTSDEIATRLHISKKTVDNHRQSLLTKTNSKSTVGLVKYAIKCGIEV